MSLCASHIPAFMHDDTPIPVVPPADCAVCVEEPTVLHDHSRIAIVTSRSVLTRALLVSERREMLGLSTQGHLRVGAH